MGERKATRKAKILSVVFPRLRTVSLSKCDPSGGVTGWREAPEKAYGSHPSWEAFNRPLVAFGAVGLHGSGCTLPRQGKGPLGGKTQAKSDHAKRRNENMPPAKKTEQTAIAPKNEWNRVMESAKPSEELYPKLNLGGPAGNDKLWEGFVDVLLTTDEPRAVSYEDPYAEEEGAMGTAYVFNVQVISGGNDPVGSMRALFVPSNESHGLTRGIANAAKKHGGKTRGIALRIETKNYQNKRYKTKTRGYTVSEISPPASPAP
jgi:hypothetical protein